MNSDVALPGGTGGRVPKDVGVKFKDVHQQTIRGWSHLVDYFGSRRGSAIGGGGGYPKSFL